MQKGIFIVMAIVLVISGCKSPQKAIDGHAANTVML